jgi:UDP-2,4-diacetamido-2,4,6-trideoxy-beta-L-altropyranose hydrolase
VSIALIADGAPDAGLGHLARSSAVAAALRARGAGVAPYAYGAEEQRTVDGVVWRPFDSIPDAGAIVLDTYTLSPAAQAEIVAAAPTAVFCDEGEPPPGAALVLAMDGVEGTGVVAGLRHAPLRAPYWGLPERRVRERVARVLVTTGGGAVQDAGVELAVAVRAALPQADVALVRGPSAQFEAPPGVQLVDAPPSLLDELLAADVVVTAAGQTALEAAATGAATIALPLVANQRRNADALAAAGAAVVVEPGEAALAAVALADQERREALARAAQLAVDGYGALRIAFRVAALLGA